MLKNVSQWEENHSDVLIWVMNQLGINKVVESKKRQSSIFPWNHDSMNMAMNYAKILHDLNVCNAI